jgi:thiol-disulfide isomerase/thioredoxin
MKQNIYFFLPAVLLTLVFYSCTSQEKLSDHALTGQLTNAPETKIYLESITDTGNTSLDSALTDKEGKFNLGNRATRMGYYLFRVDAANSVFLLLNGSEDIEINGDAKNLENTYTVSGSKDCELIRELKHYDKYISDSLFYIFKMQSEANPQSRDSLIQASQKAYSAKMNRYARQFIDLYPTSIVSLSVTRYMDHNSKEDMVFMEQLSHSLLKTYPENTYVQKFAEGLEELKFLPRGSTAPEINLKDIYGQNIKLSSLRGKVVLVDFWASWCGPCRRENPKMVELYKKYRAKGFEIYGVSLDDNKDRWIQAVGADNLTWTHVSELKKWDSEVVKTFRINAIPYSVLIDREGKVIDKGLTSEDLDKKLQEIL